MVLLLAACLEPDVCLLIRADTGASLLLPGKGPACQAHSWQINLHSMDRRGRVAFCLCVMMKGPSSGGIQNRCLRLRLSNVPMPGQSTAHLLLHRVHFTSRGQCRASVMEDVADLILIYEFISHVI